MLGYKVKDARFVMTYRMFENENFRRLRTVAEVKDLVIRQSNLTSIQIYSVDSAKTPEEVLRMKWNRSPILTYPNPYGAILGFRVQNKQDLNKLLARIPNDVDPSSIQVYMMEDAMWPAEVLGEEDWQDVLAYNAKWRAKTA